MSFRQVQRVYPDAESFCATPRNGIRLYSYRSGNSVVTVIWIGEALAAEAGFVERSQKVDLLIDDSAKPVRLGIRQSPNGHFKATRRGRSFAVHMDGRASTECFGEQVMVSWHVAAGTISLADGLLSFAVPTERPAE
jgi:hypothetical protein